VKGKPTSPSLANAIQLARKGRPGPPQDWDVPPPTPLPGPKPKVIPGQLVLGQRVDEEEPEGAA
jgi:hypothetical protein